MSSPRIFISYKRRDIKRVKALIDEIENTTGQKCWYDLDGIETSAQFTNVICKAINAAEVVLFMYSSAHVGVDFEYDWTIRELNYAQSKRKRIVLVDIDGTPLSDEFTLLFGVKNNINISVPDQRQKFFKDIKSWFPSSITKGEEETNADIRVKEAAGTYIPVLSDTHQSESDILDDIFEDAKKRAGLIIASEQEIAVCEKYIDMVIHFKWTTIGPVQKEVEELARKGLQEAEYALGFGTSYPYLPNIRMSGDEHYKESIFWLDKAASKGFVKAQRQLAKVYYYGKEPAKAIPYAKSATAKEDLDAAIILSDCFNTLNDDAAYVSSLRIAAELQKRNKAVVINSPALQFGICLFEGKKIAQDLDESIKWFDTAYKLSYDLIKKDEACLYKSKALLEQGHLLRALRALEKSTEDGPSIKALRKTILSRLNPFQKKEHR